MNPAEPIPLSQIGTALKRLEETLQQNHYTQANLFNLVVYAQGTQRIKSLWQLIRSTLTRFPNRLIFIQCDPSYELKEITAEVSSEVFGEGKNAIACDQIILKAPLQQLNRLPYLVLPHLLPDLPIYLIWGQHPSTDPWVFPHMAPIAQRIIFDSTTNLSLLESSKKTLELIKAYPHLILIDLNWLLLLGWRRLFWEVFDLHLYLEQLKTATEIEISYNDYKTDPLQQTETETLYLIAWLSERLGWMFSEYQKRELDVLIKGKNRDQKINMRLIPKHIPEYRPGTIIEVNLATRDEHLFNIAPVGKEAKVKVCISSQESCQLPCILPLASLRKDFPYIKELFYGPMSPHYPAMLLALKSIALLGVR